MDTNEFFNYFISYLIAFGLVTCGIYVFGLPSFITGNQNLVNKYYNTNKKYSFALDFFLIAIYLIIAELIVWWLGIDNSPTTDHVKQMGIVIGVTILISGSFWLLFKYVFKGDSFFSQWFETVGYKAVVYDVCLCLTIYVLYKCIFFKM